MDGAFMSVKEHPHPNSCAPTPLYRPSEFGVWSSGPAIRISVPGGRAAGGVTTV